MFAPEAMHIHKTTVIVSTEGRGEMGSGGRLSLAWRYPIIGEPEFRPISPESISTKDFMPGKGEGGRETRSGVGWLQDE